MRTKHPEHLRAFSYAGFHQYSLTFCTYDRLPRFESAETVSEALTQILRAAADERFTIIVYCFMPDHLHLIVEALAEDCDLKRFIHRAKQFWGYYVGKRIGQRLWQRYGYEHVVRDDERLQGLVRYVLENPVRKGLAERPQDFEFLGSSVYTLPELLEFAFGKR